MQSERSPDLVRATPQLLALGTLIAASLWIIRPFLIAILWASAMPAFLEGRQSGLMH